VSSYRISKIPFSISTIAINTAALCASGKCEPLPFKFHTSSVNPTHRAERVVFELRFMNQSCPVRRASLDKCRFSFLRIDGRLNGASSCRPELSCGSAPARTPTHIGDRGNFQVAFVFADVALTLPPDDKWPRKAVFWIVALGAFTPGLEVRRALTHPSFPISACDLLTAAHQLDASGAPANYFARSIPRPRPYARGAGSGLTIARSPAGPTPVARATAADPPAE